MSNYSISLQQLKKVNCENKIILDCIKKHSTNIIIDESKEIDLKYLLEKEGLDVVLKILEYKLDLVTYATFIFKCFFEEFKMELSYYAKFTNTDHLNFYKNCINKLRSELINNFDLQKLHNLYKDIEPGLLKISNDINSKIEKINNFNFLKKYFYSYQVHKIKLELCIHEFVFSFLMLKLDELNYNVKNIGHAHNDLINKNEYCYGEVSIKNECVTLLDHLKENKDYKQYFITSTYDLK